ncbi:hypothetical protein WM24_23940 [Burkholderia ubonensis]|uniref:hypothetical protein n=1 Tax=Burkholderia ubonensis TaxID=101571 RepID=UPI000755648D|nr:hypothetical protein [Burkholderia ubonensis]KWN80886.1 hypothetical protein WM24_23940 [Burkholderia ubonensis]
MGEPLVKVEDTVVGPKLIVAGVEVRQWLGRAYDDEAKVLAEKIEDALYEWMRRESIANNDD